MKENKVKSIAGLQAEVERLRKELKKKKKYGLVWEDKPEDVVEMCKEKFCSPIRANWRTRSDGLEDGG